MASSRSPAGKPVAAQLDYASANSWRRWPTGSRRSECRRLFRRHLLGINDHAQPFMLLSEGLQPKELANLGSVIVALSMRHFRPVGY